MGNGREKVVCQAVDDGGVGDYQGHTMKKWAGHTVARYKRRDMNVKASMKGREGKVYVYESRSTQLPNSPRRVHIHIATDL